MAQTFTFDADLKKFAKKAGLNLETVVRKVSFDIWNSVSATTPVDTGRAQGSWNITEEVVNLTVKPEGQYGAGSRGAVGRISGKKDVYITNNVEYIVFLEEGSSQKAPQGMTKIALAEAKAELDSVNFT
jgi:hypothetical protein